MTLALISNSDTGLSVRQKLNSLIAISNEWQFVVLTSAMSGQANASAATAAIQAGLTAAKTAGGAHVIVLGDAGTYVINSPLIFSSNTIFEIASGITLQKVNNAVGNHSMAHNENMATNVDVNIEIRGGIWDGNYANNNSSLVTSDPSNPLAGIQGDTNFIGVAGFKMTNCRFINCNGFCIQFIGSNAVFRDLTCDTNRDFLHINGTSYNILIDHCVGTSADAFIALNAWDWHRSSPTVGDISDVRIKNCAYYGSNLSARAGYFLVFLAGTRTTQTGTGVGNIHDVTVDGFVVDGTKSSLGANNIMVIMDADQLVAGEYSGAGLVENVKISNGQIITLGPEGLLFKKQNGAGGADGQNDLTVRNFVVENVHFDCSQGTCRYPVSAVIGFTALSVNDLIFRDCQWTPNNGTATPQMFVNWANKTVAERIVVDGLKINKNTSTAQIASMVHGQYTTGQASVIDDLTLDRITTAPGYQLPSAWLIVNGVIKFLRSDGVRIVGPAGGSDGQGIVLTSSTAQIVNGVVSNGYFNGVKELVQINSAVSSGNAVTLTFRDCNVLSCTHPVYVNGAFNADVLFNGGVLDTPNNIARVVTGSALLSLEDVRVSGAGASAITLVSSGTARLRRSGRASLAATTVLTPQDGDQVYWAATPAYTGVNVISGTGAGLYIYRGTGTAGWIKLN
ncbi:hypothetical protein [Oryzifoliimicrobium ureilyticus]|uniref:hypothetical protein n=1 Tax=Oryzifoliimicrobium ureilyticus TaxID=3113724 RepID=UPI0030768595